MTNSTEKPSFIYYVSKLSSCNKRPATRYALDYFKMRDNKSHIENQLKSFEIIPTLLVEVVTNNNMENNKLYCTKNMASHYVSGQPQGLFTNLNCMGK